jgi:methionine sulfoxide reductase heme-binding subunit
MGISVIWRDYGGRFSWLKLATFVLVLCPGAWLVVRLATGDLGGRPVTELIHGAGDWAVRFLLITLAVTPARAVFDWPRVLLLRRMLGVTTACYAAVHLFLYCVDEKFNMLTVVSEIVLRFYLTIGFVVLLTLQALAITSTDGWQKRLGRNWKRLHQLVYPASALALFHYYLQSKANVTLPVLFTGFWAWLMFLWLAPRRWQARLVLLPALAVLAAFATAGIEALWYALATGVNVHRVLFANLDVTFGPRPAVEVLLIGMVVFVLAALRRLFGPRRRAPARRGTLRPTAEAAGS